MSEVSSVFDPTSFADLRRRRLLALGRDQAAQARYASLGQLVGQAKARLGLAPVIKQALDELQRREHTRSVGAFESLLSALLQDVFPGERSVHLDLATARGLPALNIQISKDKNHNQREDAKSGTGGGVTNGLSLGLRLISLIRSGHRPFLVLDEPDCWTEIARVPDMARLIQEAAQRVGVQVLMISHHPDDLLSAISHRLMLERGAEGLETHWAPSSETPTWEEDQAGLRAVYFENCYGHAHTFLPLSPGVTLLRGPNDLGKSSLVSALTAALTDMGNDTMIRHDQDKAVVRMDFGPDGILQFERWRKPKKTKGHVEPKVRYTHFGAEQDLNDPDLKPLRESTRADELPDWVREISGIGDIEGLNVQLGEQKEPVFLLNESPSVRARALAIGGESAVVQSMMVQEKKELAEAKTRVNDGEKELEHLHRHITELAPLGQRQTQFEALEHYASQRAERQTHLRVAQERARRWARARATARALKPLLDHNPPNTPAPSHVAHWRTQADRWSQLSVRMEVWRPLLARAPLAPLIAAKAPGLKPLALRWAQTQSVLDAVAPLLAHAPPAAPKVTTVNRQLAIRWSQTLTRLDILGSLLDQTPPKPVLPDARIVTWRAKAQQWRARQEQLTVAEKDLHTRQAEEDESLQAVADFQQQLHVDFPVCPLCEQPFVSHTHSTPSDAP